MQIIVINLLSDIKRKVFQEKQLQKLGLNYSILNATSVDDIDDAIYQKHYYDWHRPLRRSEVACYFSHRRCWEQVISSNKPALILEDDALLSIKIPELLSKLGDCNDIDLVDLEVTGRKKNISRASRGLHENSKLLKLYLNSYGAGGYVLFPSGAKKLLEKERESGIALADAHIANCKTLDVYQVEPAAIVQFILCPYYQIHNPEFIDFQTSSTNTEPKKKYGSYFRFKRFRSEVYLGLKKLKLTFISQRRLIYLDKTDFDQ